MTHYPETVFFEGIVASDHISSCWRREAGKDPTRSINFRGLDFRRWPAMQNHLSGQIDNGEGQAAIFELGHSLMVTLVALPKDLRIESATSLRPGLVCANYGFTKPKDNNSLAYDDARFHVCAESRVPLCPHFESQYQLDCRSARLVQSKSDDFFGWKIDDERPPYYSGSDEE